MDDAERHPLDVVAEEFAERLRRGERPSVGEYARRHPEMEGELRDLLPSIAMMERLRERKKEQSRAGSVVAGVKVSQLGDYHIVREIGRGGMGVVYEARQESLGRVVALKVLSGAAVGDPVRLQRFEREARAAARLHHTNIVPVFGVGEHEGTHYFVMQYIAGQGVHEVIRMLAGERAVPGKGSRRGRRLSSVMRAGGGGDEKWTPTSGGDADGAFAAHYWRWVARVGMQVAEALRYAHEQGTLHRDIKPSNLLLDERGTVWVTDFGLAKVAEQAQPVEVTRTGDLVGTLQYMAPEAMTGPADARADVYGLGLTLYELVTLRPPFGESHPGELIRKITTTDPVAPRAVNPAIPRDLETIILKAIAREPARRYQTAWELAEDLRAFLGDLPIRARRVTWPERAWRWSRRNRFVAALGTLAVASMVIALVVGWIGYTSTRVALQSESLRRREAERATRAAEEATRRADANVQLSLRAFGEMFNRITAQDGVDRPAAPDGPKGPPRRGPGAGRGVSDTALIQSILSFYDRFAEQNATDPKLQAEAARAHLRVGDLYQRLIDVDRGNGAKAEAAFRKASGLFETLHADYPGDAGYAAGLVDAGIATYVRESPAGQTKDAVPVMERTVGIAKGLAEGADAPGEAVVRLARAEQVLARLYAKAGRTDDAVGHFDASLAAWGRAIGARRAGPMPPVVAERAITAWYYAAALQKAGRYGAAKAVLLGAIDRLERAPGGSGPRLTDPLLGDLNESLSDVARRLNDGALARRAVEEAERLHGAAGDGPGFPGPPEGAAGRNDGEGRRGHPEW